MAGGPGLGSRPARRGPGRCSPNLLRAVGRRPRHQTGPLQPAPHPKDLRPETIAAMAEVGAVCEHLHSPRQSGSDRVLAAMRRGYTAGRYLDACRGPGGHPGPGRDVPTSSSASPVRPTRDFDRTLEVVAEAEYDSAYTFLFSPRPGTRAAAMTDQAVPTEGRG